MIEVASVRVLPEYQLLIDFAHGERGVFDVRPYLDLPAFRQLRDPARFGRATVLGGTVTWPPDLDIAPETLWHLAQREPAAVASGLG
ncbi:MAG: DUF2442 domain-containing protein [Fimbriimonadaceae bacterium]|nr:DUF2442 domain-containing protein [Fimbriimonadaceae bacterium]